MTSWQKRFAQWKQRRRVFARLSAHGPLAQSGLRTIELEQRADQLDRYVQQRHRYAILPGAETLKSDDDYPCLGDDLAVTPIDPHYVYQSHWAFEKIQHKAPSRHIDVGSLDLFLALLSNVTHVTSVDIRPLALTLPNFTALPGSLAALPFANGSVASLSCLHVVEHVGLGRYGDPLDPHGTHKALAELARVLAPGGRLYLSLPVGRARTHFNAHRVFAPDQVVSMLPGLELVSFTTADDHGRYRPNIQPTDVCGSIYACGMYELTRSESPPA
ncbi:MAG: DUF268 domain-containing protein [Algisphaera sp.]